MLLASPYIHAMSMKDSLEVGALSFVAGVAGFAHLAHQIYAENYSLKSNLCTALALGTSLGAGLYYAWQKCKTNKSIKVPLEKKNDNYKNSFSDRIIDVLR